MAPRSIYPMDSKNPNLRWCKSCDYPYMPAGGCPDHVGQCLTCCAAAALDCRFRQREAVEVTRREHTQEEFDRVKADIEALYGKS